MTSSEWQDIGSAPKDGTVVRAHRVFEGDAIWRTVTFESFINGPHGVETEHVVTGWMHPDLDKQVPVRTHWRPAS